MADELKNYPHIRIKRFLSKPKEETIREPEMLPISDGQGGYTMKATGVIKYVKTGKMISRDWVEYGPPGELDRSLTSRPISEIQAIVPSQGSYDPTADAQYAFAQYVLQHYEAWKKGKALPIDGTPLEAWNGLTQEEVEALHSSGIRTVEEIANMNEQAMTGAKVARMREKKVLAARFLEASNQNALAADREADKAQLADMRERMAQQDALIAELTRGKAKKVA
jgi:hypothetical protein